MDRPQPLPLVLLVLLLALSRRACAEVTFKLDAEDLGVYSVDFTAVPSTKPSDPVLTNIDLGPCICDLTLNRCDPNCFCDAECSTTEQSLFSGNEKEGPVSDATMRCVDKDLVEVNKKGSITATIVDQLLCVTVDNNPTQGEFFTPPDTITTATFDEQVQDLQSSFKQSVTAASTSIGTGYLVGNPILAATGISTSLTGTRRGLLQLPGPDFSSHCSDSNFAEYPLEVDRVCTRVSSDLATECVTLFNGQDYFSGLFVGRFRTSSPAAPSQYIAVTFRNAYQRLSNLSRLLTSFTSATFPAPTWNAGTMTCSNAVVEVSYIFNHKSDSEITQLLVDITVADIVSTATATPYPASVCQRFKSSFNNTDDTGEVRPRSGNPGYKVGLPVLAGVSITSGALVAISQFKSGLTVLSQTGGGQCASLTTIVDGNLQTDVRREVVRFGQDMKVGCTVSMTAAELQTACTGNGLLPYLNITAAYIGLFGNADPTNIYDWTVMDRDTTTTATWNSALLRCDSLINAVDVQLLTADLGKVNNAQKRIVSARFKYYSTQNLQFKGPTLTNAEKFPVVTTVTFVHIPPDGTRRKTFVPPAPPLLPKLPSDVLFPIMTSPAPAPAVRPSTFFILSASFFLFLLCQWGTLF